MSRASRIPYHQNVYDLLEIEPGESPEAARKIAEHESRCGPLPASVKEWYLVPGVVALKPGRSGSEVGWYGSNDDPPRPLPQVLARIARRPTDVPRSYICFMDGHLGECRYFFKLNGTSDPPVYNDYGRPNHLEWVRLATTFSEYLIDCFVQNHEQNVLLRNGRDRLDEPPPPYGNGLWLRTPAEPFQPPVIDFLTDHFGDPQRTPRPGNVTTYTFHPPSGTIRVTADEPALTGGLSAWWVHADSRERLAEFARLLLPWGTLRTTLRADTDPARAVLTSVCE
jgi:hypothetical protein